MKMHNKARLQTKKPGVHHAVGVRPTCRRMQREKCWATFNFTQMQRQGLGEEKRKELGCGNREPDWSADVNSRMAAGKEMLQRMRLGAERLLRILPSHAVERSFLWSPICVGSYPFA